MSSGTSGSSPAPMITIERPLVFSALSANSRATGDDLVARHAGDFLGPGRRVGHVLVIGLGDVLAAETAIEAVIGDKQVEHRATSASPSFSCTRLAGTLRISTSPDGRCRRNGRARDCRNRESRRQPTRPCRRRSVSRRLVSRPSAFLLLEVPLALLAPAKADRPARHDDALRKSRHRRRSSIRDCWSRRDCRRSRRPAAAGRERIVALLHQPHQHRHVGVLAE